MVVVVFGMSRSGTSAVAGMLRALGVDMGHVFLEPDAGNPRGYWEDLKMLALNVSLLRVAGGNWVDPPLGRHIEMAYQHLAGQMGRLVAAKVKHAEGRPWGWKDPRNCLTLHAWHGTMARLGLDPLFIEVVRDPGSVVWSLIKRARDSRFWWVRQMRPDDWANLIETYACRVAWYRGKVELAAPGWLEDRWVTVDFEDLLEWPTVWAEQLAGAVGLEPSMRQIATAVATIQTREESSGVEESTT